VGCSGWQYASWRGRFYPETLASARWLEHYVTLFDTVELNNSFYKLPERQTFAAWRRRVPAEFLFAVKASRYLTHLKQLLTTGPPVRRLFSRVVGLGDRLGPVLYQLPARMTCDLPRLRHFLALLPRQRARRPVRHTIEFRHPSWYVDEVFAVLEEHGVALCLHDREGSVTPRRVVGPFVYVRFHGSSGAYVGGYSPKALDGWAAWLGMQATGGLDVFAYFNNDPEAQAPRDAAALRERLARLLPPPDNDSQHEARTAPRGGTPAAGAARSRDTKRQHRVRR
jgi:uncharacterized protein YecE (DUF72 family)